MARLVILMSIVLFGVYQTEQAYFLEESYIDKINQKAVTWRAGVNFHPSTPEERITTMLGYKKDRTAKKNNAHRIKPYDKAYEQIESIPEEFDAREQWPDCVTIGQVRDQGNCGSCWAMGPSSAFSDRWCIATDGAINHLFSVEEVTFCCPNVKGCGGGEPTFAWDFFKEHGLVTGGNYNSREGCEPYRVPPCPYDDNGNNTCNGKKMERNHRCPKKCYGDKTIKYQNDHKFTRDSYFLYYEDIQKDVLTYGPVSATFDVYDDFPNYKSGVYVLSEGAKYLGGHVVKLIGWGVENGTMYWLMMNSWNEQWGDNGLFKIRRGTNECDVEDYNIQAGVPNISR